jgi:hypothetical protein
MCPFQTIIENIVAILSKQILHQVFGKAAFEGVEGEVGGHVDCVGFCHT